MELTRRYNLSSDLLPEEKRQPGSVILSLEQSAEFLKHGSRKRIKKKQRYDQGSEVSKHISVRSGG